MARVLVANLLPSPTVKEFLKSPIFRKVMNENRVVHCTFAQQ